MRLTAAFIGHELRVQRRSLRFRAFAAGFLVLGCLPAILIHVNSEGLDYALGGATYAAETLAPLTFLTAVLAGLLSLDGVSRERGSGAWTTVTLAEVSSAGYFVRRWLALLAMILPLTALPLLAAAAMAAADGHPGTPAEVFAGPWLLHVAPVAAVFSALALGLGTIGGNAASTFLLLLFVVGLIPALGNQVLERFHLRLDPPIGWVDLRPASWEVARIAKAFDRKDPWRWAFPLPETEAGFDAGTEGEQELAEGLALAGLASASLGAAVLFLRRTRPDVRPQQVRLDHPLRNFLATVARLRQQYTPDPRPAPADLALLALALVAAATAGTVEVKRALHYEGLAARRFAAESQGGPAPTPSDVLPESWRIRGSFAAAGTVDLTVEGTLRNTGRQPRAHLAFSLNPELMLTAVTAGAGRARAERTWDRLAVELDPPIPPGGRRELRFRLAGRPAEPRFELPVFYIGDEPASFVRAYERHRNAAFGHDRSDLSRSYEVPAVSGLRVDLSAPALTPVPRYTAWTLDGEGRPADEVYFPAAGLELSLAVPSGLFAADSCGGVVDVVDPAADRPGRLESRCTLPLPELSVVGGRQRLLPGSGDTAVAVFPAHRSAGELHLGFLARSTRMMEEAWPGLGDLGRTVVVEWPFQEIHDRGRSTLLNSRYYDPFAALVSVRGNLVFLQEVDLIGTQALAPEPMVAEVVSARLIHRRRFDPDASLFFRQLFRNLALQRLGLGPAGGAVVGPLRPDKIPALLQPAVSATSFGYWHDRFPSLVAALQRRTGTEPLREALEELLSRGGDQPATFAELAAILARRSEGPVEPLLRDFFLAGKMPELNLEDVTFQPAGNGWRVAGRVHNLGDGEALCRVVLTTDLGPVETTVRAGKDESAAFVLATPHRPQGVFLDPDQECHRLVLKTGTLDRVYFLGGRR